MLCNLISGAKNCLAERNIDTKIRLSLELIEQCKKGFVLYASDKVIVPAVGIPDKPRLIAPSKLPKRGYSSTKARMGLVHAIAHIEFNAINLVWDAICRFEHLPKEFYEDWLNVVEEEILHFQMLRAHLIEEGYDYGDFDAHNGLWDMVKETSSDILDRMAIVPRVLEARGLDVTPPMIRKFSECDEMEIALTLEKIYEDEIGHVKTGTKWFHFICKQRNLDAHDTFMALIKRYKLTDYKGALNKKARMQAGFSAKELDSLDA